MTNKNNKTKNYTYQKISIILLIIIMISFSFVVAQLFENTKDVTMITNSGLRFLGGSVFVIILFSFNYASLFKSKHLRKSLLIIIPALIISVNNFPIIAFFDGRALLTEPVYRVYLFFIECLSIGFFEEILFRGIILVLLLKKLADKKNGVLLAIIFSSAIFGLSHVFNLYSGASIDDTLLQVGYSFLVGMMWAVIFLKTGNLWLTMLLHATYNFFGQVMFYLGSVDGRYDIYTIVITIMLAVIIAFYSVFLFRKLDYKTLIKLQ